MLAPTQLIVVPIIFKNKSEEVLEASKLLEEKLNEWGYRAEADLRSQYTSGWKFAEWEMRGVPLRIEIGPRDLKNNSVLTVRRDTGEKQSVVMDDLKDFIADMFDKISKNLKKRADETLKSLMRKADTLEEMVDIMENNRGIIQANWCGNVDCAKIVKAVV